MDFLLDLLNLLGQLVPRIHRYKFSPNLELPCPSNSAGPFVTILTYNVESTSFANENKCEKIMNAIHLSKADIICLQETHLMWQNKLENDAWISNEYPYSYYNPPTQQFHASGSAILSRFPIINAQVLDMTQRSNIFVEGSVFPALFASLDISRHFHSDKSIISLNIMNVHLRPPLELNGSASLSTARNTLPIRKKELKMIINQYPNLDFIAGDFNEHDGWNEMCSIVPDGVDALDEYVPAMKETHLWPFGIMLSLHKRLDHIIYGSRRWHCLKCGVLTGFERGASDHQPVLARFALK